MGVIKGGTVSNVVPEYAEVEVDVRVLQTDEWDRVENAVRSFKPVLDGTSIEVTGGV